MNLTKHDTSLVDIRGQWYKDQLFVTLVRTDSGKETSHFNLALDDIDLEHFIATLINFQR